MAAGRAKAAAATAPPATSAANPPGQRTKTPLRPDTTSLCPASAPPAGAFLLAAFGLQRPFLGSVDRQGAHQVGVGLLIGGAANVQFFQHLFLGPVAAVAPLQDTRPDAVPALIIGRGAAQRLGPAEVPGIGLAPTQFPGPPRRAALLSVFDCLESPPVLG